MKKVLIIEDDELMREHTSDILTLANYEVLTAIDGMAGVKLAIKELPDIIICDIVMPEMNGYEVLYMLGKNPNTASIPFIFLTSRDEKAEVRKGMSMGADDYLFKPVEKMDLLESVEARLDKKEHFNKVFGSDITGLDKYLASGMGLDALKKLSEGKKAKHFDKKEMLYMEGDGANEIVYVKKGKIKTFKLDKKGKELITGLYNEGDFIGHLDLMEGKEYRESAKTIETCEVVMVQKEDFFSLLHSNRDVAMRFILMLSGDLEILKERLLNQAYASVRKRVADSILAFEKKYTPNEKAEPTLILPENLEGMAGVTRETLSRTLHDFIDEKLIAFTDEREVKILNQDKLSKMKD